MEKLRGSYYYRDPGNPPFFFLLMVSPPLVPTDDMFGCHLWVLIEEAAFHESRLTRAGLKVSFHLIGQTSPSADLMLLPLLTGCPISAAGVTPCYFWSPFFFQISGRRMVEGSDGVNHQIVSAGKHVAAWNARHIQRETFPPIQSLSVPTKLREIKRFRVPGTNASQAVIYQSDSPPPPPPPCNFIFSVSGG